jgi:hypothetical protein
MLRTFRMMMDAVSVEVVEPLGYLAGSYCQGQRKPDAFFRGLGRMLCDLEDGELTGLRDILRGMLTVQRDLKVAGDEASLLFGRTDEATDTNVRMYVPDHKDPISLQGTGNGRRIFALLKRELFAGSRPPGPHGAFVFDGAPAAEPEVERTAMIRFQTARDILRFLEPQFS